VLSVLERCERAARPQGSRQGLNAKSAKVVVAQAVRTSHLRGRAQQCKRQDTVERNQGIPSYRSVLSVAHNGSLDARAPAPSLLIWFELKLEAQIHAYEGREP